MTTNQLISYARTLHQSIESNQPNTVEQLKNLLAKIGTKTVTHIIEPVYYYGSLQGFRVIVKDGNHQRQTNPKGSTYAIYHLH